MTVTAAAATNLLPAVSVRLVRLAELSDRGVRAGTWPYETDDDVVSAWHRHDFHQIEYAFQGIVEVRTAAAHYLLPPQQAIWIPAGLAHRTTLKRVRTVSVFFDPRMVPGAGNRARILPASPLIREMIVYAARWPVDRPHSDPLADAFFETLAGLTLEWLDRETPLCLPTSTDPVVTAAMEYTNAHLQGVTVRAVCRAAGVSERTLRRRFAATTGLTWRQYLLHSRLLRAIALLSEPGPSVLDVATTVGFDSVSAFTRAFTRYTGQNPTTYRRRVAPATGAGGRHIAEQFPRRSSNTAIATGPDRSGPVIPPNADDQTTHRPTSPHGEC